MGVARFVRDATDPQTADLAVTVIKAWRGRDLGTKLLIRLYDRARQEGIRRFTALALADNGAVASLLRRMVARVVREHGTVESLSAVARAAAACAPE